MVLMANHGNTYLHVVYAGRGDALYLEYTACDEHGNNQEHVLVSLDGGPMKSFVGAKHNAPYYKYYLTVGENIWEKHFKDPQNPQQLSPKAIVNSHPHDDHLDGLLFLIKSTLNKTMKFNGPFIVPNQKCHGFEQIENLLVNEHGFASTPGCSTPGITYYYPSHLAGDKKILSYSRLTAPVNVDQPSGIAGPKVKLPASTTIDTSSENLASILMDTDPTRTVGQGRMFFTGDSVGHYVWNHVINIPDPLSVFKIQHHGSLRNVQFQDSNDSVWQGVSAETALYAMLQYLLQGDSDSLPENPPTSPSNQRPDPEITALESFVKSFLKTTGSTGTRDYFEYLTQRNKEYMSICLGNDTSVGVILKPLDWSPPNPSLKESAPPGKVMDAIHAAIQKIGKEFQPLTVPYGTLFYYLPIRPSDGVFGRRQLTVRDWVNKWYDYSFWSNQFRAILLVDHIRHFFSAFRADSYVLSANTTHSHPSASTVAGLALAIYYADDGRRRPVELFCTDGYAIDLQEVMNYITLVDKDPMVVLGVEYINIRYLGGNLCMTINGNRGANDPGAGVSRDVYGDTELLPVDVAVQQSLKEFHVIYEKFQDSVPVRAIGGRENFRYQVFAPKQGQYITEEQFVTLGNGIQLGPDVPNESFIVLNSWTILAYSLKSLILYQTYANPIEVRVTVGERTIIKNRPCWDLAWQIPGDFITYRLCFNPDGILERIPWTPTVPDRYTGIWFALRDVTPVPGPPQPPLNSLEITSLIASAPPPSVSEALLGTGNSLEEFCVMAGIEIGTPFSGVSSLVALLGEDNFAALMVNKGPEESVLKYPTVVANSTVEFTDTGLDIKVQSAKIILSPPADAAIVIRDETKKVTSAAIELKWPALGQLSLGISLTTEDNKTFNKNHKMTATSRPINLKKTLATMGVTAKSMAKLGTLNVLAFLIADQAKMIQLVYDRAPMAMILAGLVELKPDLLRSTVQAWYDPTNQPVIAKARIVCAMSPSWKSGFNLAGIELILGEIGFVLENALLPNEKISVYGTAVFKAQTNNVAAVKLLLLCELERDGPVDLIFSVSGTNSLDTLSALLLSPGSSPPLTNATVPFRDAPLSTLPETSELALTWTQSTMHTADYMLSNILARTSFDDWKTFLPAEFPVNDLVSLTDVKIQLEILHPLQPAQRAVRATVQLDLKVKQQQGQEKIVHLQFAGTPLGPYGEHEFRLAALAEKSGLTIANIATAIGLGDVSNVLKGASPLIAQLLDEVHLRAFSVAVEKIDGKYRFSDWYVDIWIDSFVVIQDILSISNVSVTLQNTGGLLGCDLAGSIYISKTALDCTFRLPSQNLPGLITIESGHGLAPSDLMKALQLPDLSSVPVLGTLLSTKLYTAHCTLGYRSKSGGASSLSWLGSSLTFGLDEVSLTDTINIEGIHASIGYHSADDPYGPGKEQFVFLLKASLLDNAFVAQVGYDSLESTIALLLKPPSPTKLTPVSQLVGKLLGSSFEYALDSMIGTLSIKEASLVLNTKPDIKLEHFAIEVADSVSVSFHNQTLKSLRVEYNAAKVAKGHKPAVPASFVFQGSIRRGSVGARLKVQCITAEGKAPKEISFTLDAPPDTSLYLSGLRDLFSFSDPSYDKPDACPDFTGLKIVAIRGITTLRTDTQTGKQSLSLDLLDAHIESTDRITILDDPLIALETISLQLRYKKSEFSGQVYGHLKIKTVDMWVHFQKDPQGKQIFISSSERPEEVNSLPFKDLASSFVPNASEYDVPDVLKAPREIPLFAFGAKVIKNESIEVWGTGHLDIGLDVSGYQLSMLGIGILVRRIKGSDILNTPDMYSAFLIGKLKFDTFSSVRAEVRIGSGRKPMLTASVVAASHTVDIDSLTRSLSADGSGLNSIRPKGTTDLSFTSSAFLCVDFETSRLFLFGQLASPPVHGMLMAKWKPAGTSKDRSYFVSLATSNLAQIWNNLERQIFSSFNITFAGAEIVSWDGTIGDLHAELLEYVAIARYAKVEITDISTTLTALPPTESVPKGGSFFANLTLTGSNVVTQALVLGSEPTAQPPTLTLHAFLLQNTPGTSKFVVNVKSLFLFGGSILFNGDATYVTGSKSLSAEGKMKLSLTDTSFVTLDTRLNVKNDETTFSLLGTPLSTNVIDKPFDGMFNVQLKKVNLSGRIYKVSGQRKSEYALSGDVYLGTGAFRADLQGSIYFKDGRALVASLALIVGKPAIPVENVYSDIIKPGDPSSGSWPSGYGSFSFDSAQIYYAKSQYERGGVTYRQGYHMIAVITLFSKPFSITADLGNRKGIVVTGQALQPIDFGFLKLTEKEPKDSTTALGPSVRVDTTQAQIMYQAEVGIFVFDLPRLDSLFKYQKMEGLECVATYTGTILGFSNPTITVIYKDGEFHIKGWRIVEDMGDKIDIAKAIRDASEKDGSSCGKLVDLVFDKTVKTKFNITLGATGAEKPKDGLRLNLKWTYDITVHLGSLPDFHLLGLELPDLPLTISPPYSINELHKLLFNTIVDSAVSIGAVLLDPKNLPHFTALLAIMKAEKWTKETIQRLLCRKADAKNVKERGQELAENDANDMDKPDSSGNSSVVDSLATMAATELGMALKALGGATRKAAVFGTFRRGFLGFIDVLLPFFRDATKLLALKKKSDDLKRRVDENLLKAKDFMGQILNLSTDLSPPASRFIPSNAYESTVEVNWEKNKPNTKNFNYGNFDNVVWEVKIGLVDNVNDPSLTSLSTTTFSIQHDEPSYLFEKTVYSWVRARVSTAGETFYSASWARATPALHIPCLRPVKQVNFALSSTAPYSCAVSIPDSATVKYHLEIVDADGPTATTVLYETETTTTSSGLFKLNAGIAYFNPAPPSLKSCKARVRIVSSDSASVHDSPNKDSLEIIPIVPAPRDMLVVRQSDIIVSWDQPNSGANDFDLLVFSPDRTLDPSVTIKPLPSANGQRKASISGPHIIAGATVRIAARAKPTAGIGLFIVKQLTIPHLPKPRINDMGTYYEMNTGNTVIQLDFDNAVPTNLTFTFQLSPASGNPPLLQQSIPGKLQDKTVHVHLPIDLAMARITAAIEAATFDSSTGWRGVFSDKWAFPKIPGSLPACKPRASFTSKSEIVVVWSWNDVPEGSRLYVSVGLEGQAALSSWTIKRPNTSATFTMEDLGDKATPGSRMAIHCRSMTRNVSGEAVDFVFVIPGADDWTGYKLVNENPVGFSSTMTSHVRSQRLGLWWAGADGSIQGAELTSSRWFSYQLADPNTVSSQGCCLASTSRSVSHREVFWVARDGSIDGRFWVDDGKGWRQCDNRPGARYPFLQPGQASTGRGGSITTLSTQQRMDVWWVTPTGGIGTARWRESFGWRPLLEAAPSGSAGVGISITPITAQTLDDLVVDVWFISPTGSVRGTTCSSKDLSPTYEIYELVPGAAARLEGGLVSIKLSAQKVALFWVTFDDRIEMLVLTRSKDGGWVKKQQHLTEHHAAWGATGIAAIPTSSNTFHVWWIGPQSQYGALHRIDVDLRKQVSKWPVHEQVPLGKVRKARSILAGSRGGREADIWYVNSTGNIEGQSFGRY